MNCRRSISTQIIMTKMSKMEISLLSAPVKQKNSAMLEKQNKKSKESKSKKSTRTTLRLIRQPRSKLRKKGRLLRRRS